MKAFALTLIFAAFGVGFPMSSAAQKIPKEDGARVTLGGEVVRVTPEAFVLSMGKKGEIIVEMDDFDDFKEARQLMKNDHVIVSGRIDNDFYEKRTLEAGTVYVKNLGTYFYANPIDEEDVGRAAYLAIDTDPTFIQLTGRVTKEAGRIFTLDTGLRKIQVDTRQLNYNPMDDKGFQQINPGDKVSVSGALTTELFEKDTIIATSVVTLRQSRKVKSEDEDLASR